MKKIRLIIFDLDGTLVDAYGAITRSVNCTLKNFGYGLQDGSVIRKAVGWGDKQLLGAFIEKKDLSKALTFYRKDHRFTLKRYSRLLPQARNTLKLLSDLNIKLAIASNRPTEFTNIILDCLKIKDYFDYVLCADKLKRGKPNPEILFRIINKLGVKRDQAVYIGDMAIDVKAGNRAGIKTIAVCGGSSSMTEIKKARPFKVIKSLAFLKALINRVISV